MSISRTFVRRLAIKKLALYEAPFIVDDSHPPIAEDFLARLNELIGSDRRGDAVTLFMKLVGVPAIFVVLMRFMPAWSKLKAVAHTLPYDITIVKDHERGEPLPATQWASATVPALVMDGGKSPAWMRRAMRSLADVLPNAKYRTLEGQTHMVNPKPTFRRWWSSSKASRRCAPWEHHARLASLNRARTATTRPDTSTTTMPMW